MTSSHELSTTVQPTATKALSDGNPQNRPAKLGFSTPWIRILLILLATTVKPVASEAGRLSLTWADNSNNEAGFKIERSSDGRSYTEIGTTTKDTNRYVDESVVGGKKYYYRVRAYNHYGLSSYSNTSSAIAASDSTSTPATSVASAIIGKMSNIGEYTYDSKAGVHLISASGVGYESHSDALRYSYVPASGDFRMVVKVHDYSPDHGAARAGLMVRKSLAPNSRHASIALRGTGSFEALYRINDGESVSTKNGPNFKSGSAYLSLQKKGSSITLAHSNDGSNWSTLQTVNLSLGTSFLVGFTTGSFQDGRLTGAVFETVQATGITFPGSTTSPTSPSSPASPLPSTVDSEVTSSIVGSMSRNGHYAFEADKGRHVLSASGKGYETYKDELRYAYVPVSGDVKLVTRVRYFTPDGGGARAGVMIRQSLAQDSRHASIALRGLGFFETLYRAKDGDAVTTKKGASFSNDSGYLSLEKKGSTITLAYSKDGSLWTTLQTVQLSLNGPFLLGYAIGSLADGALSAAVFETQSTSGFTFSGLSSEEPETPTIPASDPATSDSLPESSILGSVAKEGEYTYDAQSNLHLLSVSGDGFESVNDVLRYTHVKAQGDIKMVARVHDFAPDGGSARVGLMIRDSLARDSRHASIVVRGLGNYEALYRASDGDAVDTKNGGNFKSGSAYLSLQKIGSSVVLAYSNDGTSWSTLRTVQLDLGSSFLIGIAIGAHSEGNLIGSVVEPLQTTGFSFDGQSPDPLSLNEFNPESSIVGSMAYNGEYTLHTSTGLHLISATGVGYERYDDSLRYAHVPASGDFRMVARVHSYLAEGGASRVGLMIRQNLATDSRHASIALRGAGFYETLHRDNDGSSVSTLNGPEYKAGSAYLSLEKNGSSVILSHSNDGKTWTTLRTVQMQFTTSFLVGLTIGGHQGDDLTSAVMEVLQAP